MRFNKNDKCNQNSRIFHILSRLQLDNRVFGSSRYEINEIQYQNIENIIISFIEDSKKYLLDSLNTENSKLLNNVFNSTSLCCGCGACIIACPKNIISMKKCFVQKIRILIL